MPELPEVELVSKALDSLVSGLRISAVDVLRERLIPYNSTKEFSGKLRNAAINRIHRRGKHILFDLDNLRTLMVHLRMSGRFSLLPPERELPKFSHAVFHLENNKKLVFSDQRHFGFMRLVETVNLYETKQLKSLAPEPFSEDFNKKYLREVLAKSSRSIKLLLLDQTKILGLGNIYASESLFLAKINPTLPTNKISPRKSAILFEKIRQVLQESIDYGSTLNINPENIDENYYGGGYENHWLVYGRENEQCVICKTRIKRIVQGGRSTYFCPKCQKI